MANAGFHHLQVGDITVTTLNDGILQASSEALAGIAVDDADAMLRERFRAVPLKITVNAFLLRDGDRLTLVDTGTGSLVGPTLGLLPQRLAMIGVEPEQISTVLMTHMHIDHLGGLADQTGDALFPNAELVMHENEAAFWFDEANEAKAPEARRSSFALARRMAAPYRERTRLARGGEVIPGVTIEPLPGHTPGHSGYLVQSGDDALLIWGDVVHVPAIQFVRPDVGMVFDTDLDAARTTRARVFDMVATDRLRVAGMHLDFPTFAHLERRGDGYAVVPEVWMA